MKTLMITLSMVLLAGVAGTAIAFDADELGGDKEAVELRMDASNLNVSLSMSPAVDLDTEVEAVEMDALDAQDDVLSADYAPPPFDE